jgi:hypothetical protein
MEPEVWGIIPAITFKRVLFPHPEGPIIAPKWDAGYQADTPDSRGGCSVFRLSSMESRTSTLLENPLQSGKATWKILPHPDDSATSRRCIRQNRGNQRGVGGGFWAGLPPFFLF